MKRYIPITEVMDRYSVYRKPVDIYPLYQTYKNIYNFQNIVESVDKWVSYSKSEKKNFDKLLELFNIVDKNDCKENREVIGRNIRRIALTLESPAAYRPSLLTTIKETTDESKKNILINIYNALSEAVQCDRMIKNHSIISKTFNIDKCVREAVYEDSIPEVIYELCSFIDTYQMGIDSKYSLALEEVLLSFKKNHISIDEDTVIRNVTDYFLSNYVHENDSPRELLTILSETLEKNRFFESNSYVHEMISECGTIIEATPHEQIMNYIEPDRAPIEEGIIDSVKEKFSSSLYAISDNKNISELKFIKNKEKSLGKFLDNFTASKIPWLGYSQLDDTGTGVSGKTVSIHKDIYDIIKSKNLYLFESVTSNADKDNGDYKIKNNDEVKIVNTTLDKIISENNLRLNIIDDSKNKKVYNDIYKICNNVLDKSGPILHKRFKMVKLSDNFYLSKHMVIGYYTKFCQEIYDEFISKVTPYIKKYNASLNIIGNDSSLYAGSNKEGIVEIKIKSSANESVTYNESLIQESFKDTAKSAIDKFKLLPVKSEALFKELIRKLTVFHTDKDVLEGTVNVFSLLFYFVIVVGAFSVGIIPGIIGGLAAATIGFKVERSYFPKVLKVWYKQRDSLSRKIDKCTNPEKKKKLEVMLKELDKNIAKLEEYADNLKGSDEPISSESRPKNYSGKDADDDMFGFNFGFDEEERNALTDIAVMCEGINAIKWDRSKMESILFSESTVAQLDNRDLDYLTEFISKYPDALDKDRWKQCLLNESTRVSKDSGYAKYVRMDVCNECVKTIKSSTDTPYTEDIFLYLNNLYEYTSNITQSMYSINEMGIGSTIAMAGHKLMDIASKLSDKEQIISRNIDAACRMLSRSVERANNMEDREAIIRGEILPPVSKIIKLAAVTGVAYFIHPALAAITLLGKIVMSRKGRQKEKQLVIDELEVELKMIDKYISDADEKKNYKKEKELMLIKKKLQTQYDRLAYKTKYESPDGDKYKFSKDND